MTGRLGEQMWEAVGLIASTIRKQREKNAGPPLLFTQSGTPALEWRHLLSGWVFLPQLSSLQMPTLTNMPIEVSSGWFQVQSRSTMNIGHHKAVMWRVGWLLSSDNVLTAAPLPSSPDRSFLDNGFPRRDVINKSLFLKLYLASAVMFKQYKVDEDSTWTLSHGSSDDFLWVICQFVAAALKTAH